MSPSHAQPTGIHRSFTHLCEGWETPLSLLTDGAVERTGMCVGGNWKWHDCDNLEVVFHCHGQQENAQTHQFQCMHCTDAFRLTGRPCPGTYLITRKPAASLSQPADSGIPHSFIESSHGFETRLSLLTDGTVKFNGKHVGGSWQWQDGDNVNITFHCNGYTDWARSHCYQRIRDTDVFRLTGVPFVTYLFLERDGHQHAASDWLFVEMQP